MTRAGNGSDEHILLEFMRDKIDNLQNAFDEMKRALKTALPTIKYMSSAVKYFREPIQRLFGVLEAKHSYKGSNIQFKRSKSLNGF